MQQVALRKLANLLDNFHPRYNARVTNIIPYADAIIAYIVVDDTLEGQTWEPGCITTYYMYRYKFIATIDNEFGEEVENEWFSDMRREHVACGDVQYRTTTTTCPCIPMIFTPKEPTWESNPNPNPNQFQHP